MKISFCTSCMGRSYQLKQTLKKNLEYAKDENVEFVILNYNSKDDIHDWMLTEIQPIHANKVVYFRTDLPEYYSSPHAKNCAHKLGSGDVLVNLDADNFINDVIPKIKFWFNKPIRISLAFRTGAAALKSIPKKTETYQHDGLDGAWGKIATRKSDFYKIGGYNEQLKGMGAQDADLVRRLRARGITNKIILSKTMDFIPNNKAASIENINPQLVKNFSKGSALARWHCLNRFNSALSLKNISEGKIEANLGQAWGECGAVQIF